MIRLLTPLLVGAFLVTCSNVPGRSRGKSDKDAKSDKNSDKDGDDKDVEVATDGGDDALIILKEGESQQAGASVAGATLTDLWNGRAVFKLIRADAGAAITDGNKISFVTMPTGTWYAFARQPGCTNCALGVRSSDDQGATWSEMALIAAPPPGTTTLVDQDAYYDAESNRFYLISQCLTPAGWRLCSFTRDGADPMGPFTSVAPGPIIRSGYLFQEGGLCSAGHCPANTGEEGTPDVMFKLNGIFYVSIHGFDGVHGYRGAAATTDFNVGWRVDSAVGLARDVMLGPLDCAQWHPGCIGIADTTTLIDGEHIYMIAESADGSLLCQPGQAWMSALMRSKQALAFTGGWEMFSRNPLANTGASPTPCKMNYQKMFRDEKTGFVYLTYWWHNGATYELRYYRLEPGDGRGGALVPPVESSQPAAPAAMPAADEVAAAAAAAASVPLPPQDIGHFQLAGILAKNNGGYPNCHTSLMTVNGTNRPGVAPIPSIWATPCFSTFGGAPECTCPTSAHWEPVAGHVADGCTAMQAGLAAQGLAVSDEAWDCCMIEFKCMQ